MHHYYFVPLISIMLAYPPLSQELRDTEELPYNIIQCLAALPKDLDKTCSNLAIRTSKSAGDQHRRIANMVDSVVLLRWALCFGPGSPLWP